MARRAASHELMVVRTAIRAGLSDLAEASTVMVACSGGPDSLALAGASTWVASRARLHVQAVVVDHGLQDGSADVAAEAAAACRALGIDRVNVMRVHVGREGGPEAAARDARYAALEQAAVEAGAAAVLLGHTMDDQAETVLLRLARGSGARALSSMASVSGLWRRPFLGLRRAEVHAAAAEMLEPHGLVPWTDPHNADPRFLRVRARRAMDVLENELGTGVVDGLARSARLARADADALDALAHEAYASQVVEHSGSVDAEISGLARLSDALRWRVLRRMAITLGAEPDDVDSGHVMRLDAFVVDWHGQGVALLPAGIEASRAYGRLSLRRTEKE